MRYLALGLDLRPPDATMTQTDAVLVQWLGNDDVVDPGFREIAEAGQMGHAAEATGLLVDRAGYFDGTGKVGEDFQEGFRGDDRSGKATLHVAGTATIDLAVPDNTGKGIDSPAVAGF